MKSTRDQILISTCNLLENQGFYATGLNEIVRESGAPKGSIYYYFPGGKDEIVSEAVLYAGKQVSGRIRSQLAKLEDPVESIRTFIETIAQAVEASGFRAGGPLTTVASESATTNERINLACREAYQMIKAAFQDKLASKGLSEEDADRLAFVILSAIEGGIILSRTYRTGDPLRLVAGQVACLLDPS